MTLAPDQRVALARLEAALRVAHRGRVRDLMLELDADGLAVSGVAVSYYAIQLVLRDVLAEGVVRCRNRIRVRPPVSPPTPGDT